MNLQRLGVMLAGDNRTYALIEDMFRSLSACFTTRVEHIGMGEAHMVGLGKYLGQPSHPRCVVSRLYWTII